MWDKSRLRILEKAASKLAAMASAAGSIFLSRCDLRDKFVAVTVTCLVRRKSSERRAKVARSEY
jgi:hypothetical protein